VFLNKRISEMKKRQCLIFKKQKKESNLFLDDSITRSERAREREKMSNDNYYYHRYTLTFFQACRKLQLHA